MRRAWRAFGEWMDWLIFWMDWLIFDAGTPLLSACALAVFVYALGTLAYLMLRFLAIHFQWRLQ